MSVTLRRSKVPEYLKDSLFYKNLSESDDDDFLVSSEHFKADSSIAGLEDLDIILSTLRFWGTTAVPIEIYAYLLDHWTEECEVIISTYSEELLFLKDIVTLSTIPRDQRTNKALKIGNRSITNYILDTDYVFDELTSVIAASRGDVSVLQQIHALGCVVTPAAVTAAASYGHVECLKYFVSLNDILLFTDNATFAAAEGGHLNCLQFLFQLRPDEYLTKSKACDRAATCGRAACLRFIVEDINRNVGEYLETVAESGDLECLQYVHSVAGQWDPWSSPPAILHGNSLECLQYALQTGCIFREIDMMDAADRCSTSVVQLLFEHGVAVTCPVAASAAYHDRLDCLQYLHEQGCAWDEKTCSSAAEQGHLRCLQFAHEHGCAWDAEACEKAVERNHLRCLQYLHEHHCPWDQRTIEAAVQHGSIECLTYARQHACPAPSTFRSLKKTVTAFASRIIPPKAEKPDYFDIAQYVP